MKSSYLETILKSNWRRISLWRICYKCFLYNAHYFYFFRKGFDSGRVGKAEMGEWPWHVSIHLSIYFSVWWIRIRIQIRLDFGRLNPDRDSECIVSKCWINILQFFNKKVLVFRFLFIKTMDFDPVALKHWPHWYSVVKL